MNKVNKHYIGCVFEINTDFLENKYKLYLVRCVNDVITHNKLHDRDCYHIILYARHNKLAKKYNEPLPESVAYPELVSGGGSKNRKFKCLVKVGATKGVTHLI